MATLDDLTRGREHDEALEAIDRQLPGMWYQDESSMMLALILLDKHYGMTEEGGYVYVNPMCFWAVSSFEILDPDVAKAFKDTETELSEAEQSAAEERATREPFSVRLSYNPAMFVDGKAPADDILPKELHGQTILVRFMTDEDAVRLPGMLTVRADGAPIVLPTRRYPRHVD